MDAKAIFNMGSRTASLGLIVTEGARELGEKVDRYLVEMAAGSPRRKAPILLRASAPVFPPATAKD